MIRETKRGISVAGATLVLLAVAAGPVQATQRSSHSLSSGIGSSATELYYSQDPADSLYRAARRALNQGSYREAARSFRQLGRQYSSSSYVGKSLYWEAYTLYRLGGEEELREARKAVLEQQEKYSGAARSSDSRELAALIDGKLASDYGDAEAAARISERANRGPVGAGGLDAGSRGPEQAGSCPEEDDDVRLAAINALMNMNSERAIPILKKVLERRDACSAQLRKKAVFVITQHRSEDVTDILLDVVKNDPDTEVREAAVFWISQVDSERAVDALEEILRSEDNRTLQEKAIFALSQHDSERAGEILREYARREDVSVGLREKAIFWLSQHGGRENAEFLLDLYGEIDSRELKEKIIFSLSQIGGNAAWLLEIATDESEDIELRKKAIFWAGQTGASLEEFSRLYRTIDNREIKEQLIFAFSQSSSRDAVDVLMDIAKNDPDGGLRKKAIFWLGQSNDPRVAEFLLELINQ